MKKKKKKMKKQAEETAGEELKKENEDILAEDTGETPDTDEAAEQSEDASGKTEAEEEVPEEEEHPAKPDKKDEKIRELNDRYVRLFAEFDNFRKRTDAEKTGMFTEGEKTVLLKVLPLIDNFERALQSVPEEEKDSPFTDGVHCRFLRRQKERMNTTARNSVIQAPAEEPM